MATGRTVARWARVYADGYDLSGYARTLGALGQEFDAPNGAALADEVQGALIGQAMLSIGTINAFFDNTATLGLHVVANGAGVKRVVMIPLGVRGEPAQGDPVFIGEFEQLGYSATPEQNGYVVANIPFGNADAVAAHLAYQKPWGTLLHAKGAETAVNAATGVDDNGAATARGGFLCYQIFSSDGTVTIKVQDAATNSDGSFSDLSGATSGSQDASATPKSGIVALATTATVRRYLRWQIVLGTANTVMFALAFVRGQ